ncbi:embigin isoform X2 [Genypterus blacodes]
MVSNITYTSAVMSVVLKGENQTENVQLLNRVRLELDCTWAANENKQPNITGYWTRDGDEIEDSRLTVPLQNEQYNLKRVFNIEHEEDLRKYSCVFGSQAQIQFILTVPGIDHVPDKPIVSYIGDYVALVCKIKDTAPKPDTWRWYKSNETDKVRTDVLAEPGRYEIKNEDLKTTLVVYNLTKEDSGVYHCGAVYPLKTSVGELTLNVLSFMEPLKILFAIVAEVIILVAAILLFEKWQSKKKPREENGMNPLPTDEMMQEESNSLGESSALRQRNV